MENELNFIMLETHFLIYVIRKRLKGLIEKNQIVKQHREPLKYSLQYKMVSPPFFLLPFQFCVKSF